MFGLSMRERLSAAIIRVSEKNVNDFRENLLLLMEEYNIEEDESDNFKNIDIINNYLDTVADEVFSAFYKPGTSNIYARIMLALTDTALCGYEELNTDTGVRAGTVYAICYWATTNKIANSKDCVTLNHLQNDIIMRVLSELDCA